MDLALSKEQVMARGCSASLLKRKSSPLRRKSTRPSAFRVRRWKSCKNTALWGFPIPAKSADRGAIP